MPGRPRTMLKRVWELSNQAERLKLDLLAAAPRAYREHELVTGAFRRDVWKQKLAELWDRDFIAARWVHALREAEMFDLEIGILALELEAKAERNGVKLDLAPELLAVDV